MNLNELDNTKNAMQNVKQRFFALRNGVLADVLRKGGSPFRIIFGLNVPQLRQIADVFGYDNALADALWNNTSTRESRLLAPMLANPADFGREKAHEWLAVQSGCSEDLDIFAHALLRKTAAAKELAEELRLSDDSFMRYVAIRLMHGLIADKAETILEYALYEISRNDEVTFAVASQLRDEALFRLGRY